MTPALTGALDYMPVAAAMPFGHNTLCETDVRHPPQNKGAAAMNILVRYAPSGPDSCAAAMALRAFSSCSPRLLILVVGLWCQEATPCGHETCATPPPHHQPRPDTVFSSQWRMSHASDVQARGKLGLVVAKVLDCRELLRARVGVR